jgi:hypothetical protein
MIQEPTRAHHGRDPQPDLMIQMLNIGVCEFAAGHPQADDLAAVIILKT